MRSMAFQSQLFSPSLILFRRCLSFLELILKRKPIPVVYRQIRMAIAIAMSIYWWLLADIRLTQPFLRPTILIVNVSYIISYGFHIICLAACPKTSQKHQNPQKLPHVPFSRGISGLWFPARIQDLSFGSMFHESYWGLEGLANTLA